MTASSYVGRRKKPISLTALIDVVFILLMFFMLSSTFERLGSLSLQQAGTASVSPEIEATSVVFLHADGQFSHNLGGQKFSLVSSEGAARIDKNKALVVIPAAQAHVQKIVTAMAQLRRIGVREINLGESLNLAVEPAAL